jgi:riboflavin biosynthesis pyrimidine reductase
VLRLDHGPELTPEQLVEGLGLLDPARAPEGRPRVAGVMIASVDGRATVEGRSSKLGHPEDRRVLRGLRAAADAVLAGTATLAAERYADLLDPDQRAARAAAGRPPHPIVATVSRSGDVPWDVPVFGEPGVPCQVYTGREAGVPAWAVETEVEVLRPPSFLALLGHLHRHRGVRAVSCEGGPRVLRALVAEGCLDDLVLTVAPLLVAGDGPASLAGEALAPPPRMALAAAHRADDHLFLHYVRAPGPEQ